MCCRGLKDEHREVAIKGLRVFWYSICRSWYVIGNSIEERLYADVFACRSTENRNQLAAAYSHFDDGEDFLVAQFFALQELLHNGVVALDRRLDQLFAVSADFVF